MFASEGGGGGGGDVTVSSFEGGVISSGVGVDLVWRGSPVATPVRRVLLYTRVLFLTYSGK